jgi:hypothetical protein
MLINKIELSVCHTSSLRSSKEYSGSSIDPTKIVNYVLVDDFEISYNREELSSFGYITIPNKVNYYRDVNDNGEFSNTKKISWDKSIKTVLYNSFNEVNILVGDTAIITTFYIKGDGSNEVIENSIKTHILNITEVSYDTPIKLTLQDNMYLLKNTSMPNKEILPGDNILKSIKDGLDRASERNNRDKVNTKIPQIAPLKLLYTDASIKLTTDDLKYKSQPISTAGISVAQFLDKIKKEYRLNSYFIDNVLVFGYSQYVDSSKFKKSDLTEIELDNVTPIDRTFVLNTKPRKLKTTIIDNSLNVKSLNSNIAAIAYNTYTKDMGKTKKGRTKTNKIKVSIYMSKEVKGSKVIVDGVETGFNYIILYDNNGNKKEDEPNVKSYTQDTERYNFPYPNALTVEELIPLCYNDLKRYNYTGYEGSFTTFGTPTVKIGDHIKIINNDSPSLTHLVMMVTDKIFQ